MSATQEAVVIKSDMPDKIQKMAIECARKALESFEDHEISCIAQYIKTEFENKFGTYWACIVGNKLGSYFSFAENTFISFYIGDLLFLLFKYPS